MIAKKYRFHGYGSLRFVYTKGRTVRTRFLSLKFHENTRRPETRLAVVVAKKVTKKAPDRNRIRRRIYEVMRVNLPNLKSPHDMVITVFDERVATIPSTELETMVKELLAQAKVLKT